MELLRDIPVSNSSHNNCNEIEHSMYIKKCKTKIIGWNQIPIINKARKSLPIIYKGSQDVMWLKHIRFFSILQASTLESKTSYNDRIISWKPMKANMIIFNWAFPQMGSLDRSTQGKWNNLKGTKPQSNAK